MMLDLPVAQGVEDYLDKLRYSLVFNPFPSPPRSVEQVGDESANRQENGPLIFAPRFSRLYRQHAVPRHVGRLVR